MHTIIKIAVVSVLALFAIVGVVSISKAEEWVEFWNKQPDIFELSFVCKDDYNFRIRNGKTKTLSPQARFVKLIFEFGKSEDKRHITFVFDEGFQGKEMHFLETNFGYYSFRGEITDQSLHISFDFNKEGEKILHYTTSSLGPAIFSSRCRVI